jgi:hypothetical protein
MEDQKQVEVILRDNTVAQASKIMAKLIAEEVANTIKENDGDFDLTTAEGIEEAGEAIAYYLELVTNEKVKPTTVNYELRRQLE